MFTCPCNPGKNYATKWTHKVHYDTARHRDYVNSVYTRHFVTI